MTLKALSDDPIKDEPVLFGDDPEDKSPVVLESEVDFVTLEELASAKPGLKILVIPEIHGKVRIRTLNGAEVDRYRSSITTGKGPNQTLNQRGMRAKLVVLSLANEDGSRMLQDNEANKLQQWPSIVLERIFDASRKWNGLTETDSDTDSGNS